MGLCISRSPASAVAAGAVPTKTVKIVDMDGSMVQFTAPVTAGEALGGDHAGRRGASVFLCSSDELSFDVPARALAADEALKPGWLYFVLPVSMLRRSLSGPDMAALAARASSALAVASGVASPPRRNNGAANSKRRKASTRVAPLLVPDELAGPHDGPDHHHAYGKYGVDEAARRRSGRGGSRSSSRRRRRAGTQRLSSILEADDF